MSKEIDKTYGIHHFRVPNEDAKLKALDLDKLDKANASLIGSNLTEFYNPIFIPKKSDWLWEHREKGQSFKSYSQGMIARPTKQMKTVYIKNLDFGLEDSFLSDDILEVMRLMMEAYFPGIDAKVLKDETNFETLKIKSRQNDPYF